MEKNVKIAALIGAVVLIVGAVALLGSGDTAPADNGDENVNGTPDNGSEDGPPPPPDTETDGNNSTPPPPPS